VRITESESFATVPGMEAIGRTLDQDSTTLALQWRGVQASTKEGATLGNYQEVRIRHCAHTLDEWLAR
jgi:hypothetical protein